MRRLETAGVVVGVLLAVVLPSLVHGVPDSPRAALVLVLLAGSGLALAGWRTVPRAAAAGSLGLLLAALALGGGAWVPDSVVVVLALGFAVLGLGWSGRAAVVAGGVGVLHLAALLALGAPGSGVALAVFTVPGYVAGTILRLRRETADALALRAAELEREQEELARLSVRQERQRIAGELHDVVGHAVSVLVIQAAAGQRLLDSAPERVEDTFGVIAESARRGTADLERLVDLLGGTPDAPDLSLVDDVVAHAARSGLDVTYRLEADRATVPERSVHLVHRVVQEGLTNALRHAAGSSVRIRVAATDGGLVVRVENDATTAVATLRGSGQGLLGLRERLRAQGGSLRAGPTPAGGWLLEARLPSIP